MDSKKEWYELRDECPYYNKIETDYDIMSGHSDYKLTCSKLGTEKELFSSFSCKHCIENGNNIVSR